MDRRRLEDALFLFGSLEVVQRLNFTIGSVPHDDKVLLKRVNEKYHDWFEAKWAGMYFNCIYILYISSSNQ